jgi:cyanate permease
MPCAQLHVAWVQAFTSRPAAQYSALTVPLGYAVTRCAPQMDGVLADAIVHHPAAHALVVAAIDPFTSYGDGLRATCAALPAVAGGTDTPVVRERATDALLHACHAPG